ncbi:YcxB family protein [Hyphococcus luteus]|uniref:YcxB-like protein domain-containing protein n=1 Tax=Hyphococcus luteus TaxID=2058213 RepID=A0A2S7K1P6_9PROT|nr:YcxB family protein [Marinicaulis flavus]PQA86430.1 hypothetical protein CW354_19055 [Marinicaulis flavus]
MSIRADIDPQDIANLQRDVRKRITRASMSLAGTAALLAALFFSAGFAAWRAFTEIAESSAAPLAASFAQLLRAPTPDFITFVISIAVMAFSIIAAVGVYKARRALDKAKRQARLKNGLTIGRFDYQFTENFLVIKSPMALKKVAWSAIDRIENAKTNLIFWKYDGSFEFLPKNVIKQKDLLETLLKNHGAAIKSNLSFDEAVHAKPLSVSFECFPEDLAEYRAHYHRQREGVTSLLRGFAQWRPWPAFLFLVFAGLAAAALYTAFRAFDLAAAAIGFAAAFAAAGVFIANARFFRGPAHPLRKDKKWPFAQTEITVVTLSKSGLFISRNGVTEAVEWQGVQQFLECRLTSYLVIMADYAVPLPKRIFLNAEHYRAFSSFAKARLSEASRVRAEHKQQRLMSSLHGNQGSKQAQAKAAPAPKAGAGRKPVVQKQPAQQQPVRKPQTQTARVQKQAAQKQIVQKPGAKPGPAANAPKPQAKAPAQQAQPQPKPAAPAAKKQPPQAQQTQARQAPPKAMNGQAVNEKVAPLNAGQVQTKTKPAAVKARQQAANG